MPASYEPEGERTGRRRLTWLFWAGVGVAPLAALLLLLGQGVGALRAAAVLAVLSVVMIGLSVTLREDVTTVRDDFSETLRREVDLVRADVDTLRRGVELTMHRELERVRGELEAARQDTVFRAEATRLQAVEGRYERISGEVPSAEDFQTIEPIREEFVNARDNSRTNGRAQQPMMTEQIRVDTIRADAIRSEPVRVAAARADDGAAAQAKVNSGTTYSSAARAESSGYERYESYDEYDAPASAPPAPAPVSTGAELERLSAPTTRWSAPSWDSGMDEPQATAEWQPPAWDGGASASYSEPAYSEPAPATTYSPSGTAGTYSSSPSTGTANGYDTPSGSYGFGRNAAASTGTAASSAPASSSTYGSSTNSYSSESYSSSDVISGDVLSSDTSYDDYGSSTGWSSPTTYSLGSDALGSFGSESLGGSSFGSGNGFGAGNGFGNNSFGNDSGLSGYRSGLPELPALPSSASDSNSWSRPADKSQWETPSWDDSSSYSNSWSSTPSTDAWAASETYSTPASQEYSQPSDFELPSLDHLPTVNVQKSIGGYATTTSIGGYATTTSIGGYASGGTPSTGRHSGGGADRNGSTDDAGGTSGAGDYNRGYEADLPAERRIFLDLPEQSYNWRG